MMAEAVSPLHFDLEQLLAPISAERHSGDSLRHTEAYDEIAESRRYDDPMLPQGVWRKELKEADWPKVAALCLELIETRSKDLQLAVWLLEAWQQLFGFVGTHRGLELVLGLCESFWPTLHPELEDGDLDARLRPLHFLNDKLSISLKMVAITRPETDESQVYSWADWEAALHLERLSQSDPQAEAAAEARGKVTREKFLAAVTLTPTPFYEQHFESLGASIDMLDRLGHWLERECGHEAPSLARFRETLEAELRFVAGLLAERHDTAAEVEEGGADDASAALAMDEGERLFSSGGPISSRAEAYRRLAEASDYLLRTEPHSPAPYLVRRAIAWGGMSLAELLEELLAENADLRTVYRLLGIRQ